MRVIHCCSTERWIARLPKLLGKSDANRAFSGRPCWCSKTVKEMVAMMVYQTNPLGSELLFSCKYFFYLFIYFQKSNVAAGHVSENAVYAGGKLSL